MEIEEQAIHLELKAFQEQKLIRNTVVVQDGAKDVDATYLF